MSVTLVDCDHAGWNSLKLISQLVSLVVVNVIVMDLLQREHPEILTGIGVGGVWKKCLTAC